MLRVHGLDELAEILARDVVSEVSSALAEVSLNLISDGFARGADPYGEAWDAPNNLQITGGIKAFTKRSSDRGGFVVGTTDRKASWHHEGVGRLPRRLLVPEGTLPDAWSAEFEAEASAALERILS